MGHPMRKEKTDDTSRRFSQRKGNLAFTLVELLVVIAVVASLLCLLLVATGRMRENATAASCLGNLRQIHHAATIYMGEHNGYLPAHMTTVGAISWADTLYATLIDRKPGNKLIFRVPDFSSTKAPTPRAPFDCPASKPDIEKGIRLSIDYTINIHMTEGYGRAMNTRIPSKRALIMDGYRVVSPDMADQGTSPNVPVNYNALTLPENKPAYRHGGAAHILFFDGHVERMTYEAVPKTTGDPNAYPERYFWGEASYEGSPGRAP